MLLFVLFGCSGNSSTNPPGAIILHATDFLMPNRVGSQTLFRVVNIAADTNGFSDTSFRGTVSYTVADTAFRFTPNIRAILIHVGGTDSAGTTVRHQWAEGWIPGQGWMGFDPAWGKS